MSELKPCPFCGGEVTIWNTGFGIVKVIECKKCDLRFVYKWSVAGSNHELAEIWNKRSEDSER